MQLGPAVEAVLVPAVIVVVMVCWLVETGAVGAPVAAAGVVLPLCLLLVVELSVKGGLIVRRRLDPIGLTLLAADDCRRVMDVCLLVVEESLV